MNVIHDINKNLRSIENGARFEYDLVATFFGYSSSSEKK